MTTTTTTTAHDDTPTIACTLSATERDAAERTYVEAAQHYTATAELRAHEALITLHGDLPQLQAILADMTAREAGCCSWLAIEQTPLASDDGLQVRLTLAATQPSADDLAFAPVALREMLALLFPTATVHATT